jgi:hypothetical protein
MLRLCLSFALYFIFSLSAVIPSSVKHYITISDLSVWLLTSDPKYFLVRYTSSKIRPRSFLGFQLDLLKHL